MKQEHLSVADYHLLPVGENKTAQPPKVAHKRALLTPLLNNSFVKNLLKKKTTMSAHTAKTLLTHLEHCIFRKIIQYSTKCNNI